MVDRLHGSSRRSSSHWAFVPGICGIGSSTILGSGEVGLILDVPLLARASRRMARRSVEAGAARPALIHRRDRRAPSRDAAFLKGTYTFFQS